MNFSRTLIAAATVSASLLASSPALASEASASVSAPETLTTTIAKNFTRSSVPKNWTVGGCRKVTLKSARCSAYEEDGTRLVATVRLLDDRLAISFS